MPKYSDICGLDAYEHMFSLDTSGVIRMFNDTQSEVFNKIIVNHPSLKERDFLPNAG